MRDIITFQCTECKNRNYSSTKNKMTTTAMATAATTACVRRVEFFICTSPFG